MHYLGQYARPRAKSIERRPCMGPDISQRPSPRFFVARPSCDGSVGGNKPSPAYDHGFDAVASFRILPITAIPSTREGNHIRTDMVLAKDLQWPIEGWFPFVNERIDTLLSCCHPVFHLDQTKSGSEAIRDPQPLGSLWPPYPVTLSWVSRRRQTTGHAKLEFAPIWLPSERTIRIMEIQWHSNQITAETELNGRGRHAREPRTSKENGRKKLHCAKRSVTQQNLRPMTNKIAEKLEIRGNTIADQLFRSFEYLPGDVSISRQFLIRGYAAWMLPTAILPVRRSS